MRIMMVGQADGGIGKTSFWYRWALGNFPSRTMQTMGMDFKVRRFRRGGEDYKIQLFDSASRPRFDFITATCLQQYDVDGILVFVSRYDRDSLLTATQWLERIRVGTPTSVTDEYGGPILIPPCDPNASIMLVGAMGDGKYSRMICACHTWSALRSRARVWTWWFRP